MAPSAPATMRAPSGNVSAAAALRAKLMGPRKTAEKSAVDGAAAALPLVGEDGRAAPRRGAPPRFRAARLPRRARFRARRGPRSASTRRRRRRCGTTATTTARRFATGSPPRSTEAARRLREKLFRERRGDKRYKGSKTERERDEAVDDEYDNDLGLEMYEKRDKKQSGAKQQEKARQRQVAEYERSKKKLASCALCLDNPRKPPEAPHVAYGNHAYLMLPASGRFVTRPALRDRAHRALPQLARLRRAGVGGDAQRATKCLTKMFAAQGKEACFLETCVGNGSGGSGAGDVVQVGGGLGSSASKRRVDRSTDRPRRARGGFGGGAGGARAVRRVRADSVARLRETLRCTSRRPSTRARASGARTRARWRCCLSTAPPKGLRQSIPESFPYFHVEFNMLGASRVAPGRRGRGGTETSDATRSSRVAGSADGKREETRELAPAVAEAGDGRVPGRVGTGGLDETVVTSELQNAISDTSGRFPFRNNVKEFRAPFGTPIPVRRACCCAGAFGSRPRRVSLKSLQSLQSERRSDFQKQVTRWRRHPPATLPASRSSPPPPPPPSGAEASPLARGNPRRAAPAPARWVPPPTPPAAAAAPPPPRASPVRSFCLSSFFRFRPAPSSSPSCAPPPRWRRRPGTGGCRACPG